MIFHIESDSAFATVPRFVRSVYDMLQIEDQRILSWSADGSYFQVHDVPRLEVEVLCKYFKHGKFSSFQRQLNNFGFHKWTKTRASVATFSHEVLVRCHPSQLVDLVGQLKQKVPGTPFATSTTSTKRRRRVLADTLTTMTASARLEVVAARKKQRCDVVFTDDISSIFPVLEHQWVHDDSCEQNELLFDALNCIDLVELDWDVTSSTFKAKDSGMDCASIIDDDFDANLQLDGAASSLDLLGEEDVSTVLVHLDSAQRLFDCELDGLLGLASSDSDNMKLAFDDDIELAIGIDAVWTPCSLCNFSRSDRKLHVVEHSFVV